MKAKRAKQYRRLMQQFSQTFGFREPYQVLVDAELVKESLGIPMSLQDALERILQGKIKPMITQCCMRHLYTTKDQPGVRQAIAVAQKLERRRCGHHPDEYPDPLSAEACISSVVDPRNAGTNKHCYVVASQSQELRRRMRSVRGVPLVHVRRGVMIMEPMADESAQARELEEKKKFRAGLRDKVKAGEKRKRDDDDGEGGKENGSGGGPKEPAIDLRTDGEEKSAAKKKWKPAKKEPNPLSQKKKKAKADEEAPRRPKIVVSEPPEAAQPAKKKRKRAKKKSVAGTESQSAAGQDAAAAEGSDSDGE